MQQKKQVIQKPKKKFWQTTIGIITIVMASCFTFSLLATIWQEITGSEPTIVPVDVQNAAQQTIDESRKELEPTATMPSRFQAIDTDTPEPEPTETVEIIELEPTDTQKNVPCSCEMPDRNCDDFASQRAAQACFDYCISIGAGDVYKLDRDNDGRVCEG